MQLRPFIIVPARDEASILEASCLSLGFDRAGTVSGRNLIVVDNGSSDATGEVARAIMERSPRDAVTVVHEPEPGHVPARHAGAMAALRWAIERRVDPSDLLVLQADADTIYRPGYVERIVREAERAGPGHLVEGCSVPPEADDDPCAAFRALEAAVDAAVVGLVEPDDPYDVIVDDKVAAFRLSDYLAWGGHIREYDNDGDEVLAETTRLYLRAVRRGARRIRAEECKAVTSSRRILEAPAVAFATAGYPRPRRWVACWQNAYLGPTDLAAFVLPARPALREAIATREAHMRGLFGLLPAHVRSLDSTPSRAEGPFERVLADAGLLGATITPGDALSRSLALSVGT